MHRFAKRVSWAQGLLLIGLLLWLGGCTIIPTPPPAAPATSLLPVPTQAPGEATHAHILFVRMTEESGGTWRFEVTVQHADEGEEHYADRWEILIPLADGQTLRYTRELAHPHVDEQPFTRSLSGIEIPEGATEATVRAHDSKDGYGGQQVTLELGASAGPGFQIIRK